MADSAQGYDDARSIPDLFSALAGNLATLVRKESELVRTEVTENIRTAARGMMWIAVGAAMLIGAFLVLLQAIVLGLAVYIGALAASILVGLVLAVIGALVIRNAASRIGPHALAPDRSVAQLGKDAQMVKEQVS